MQVKELLPTTLPNGSKACELKYETLCLSALLEHQAGGLPLIENGDNLYFSKLSQVCKPIHNIIISNFISGAYLLVNMQREKALDLSVLSTYHKYNIPKFMGFIHTKPF